MQPERQSLVQELLKSIDQQNNSITATSQQPLHEFQWFELDNKIRILVHQLLEPHLHCMVQQRGDYDKLTQKVDHYINNYEEFKALYFQNGKGTPIIQQLRQQILELQQNFAVLQTDAQFTIQENNRKLDALQFLKDQQFHQLKLIENNQSSQTDIIEKYRIQNQEFKKLILDSVEQVKKENQYQILQIQDQLLKINIRFDTYDCHIQDIKARVNNNYEIVTQFEEKLLKEIQTSKHIESEIDILKNKIPDMNELFAYDRKVSNQLELMNTRLKYFENYIEKYFPLYLQGTISDTLHNILGEDEKFKLAIFEENKFTELHRIIVEDDGNPNLEKKINEFAVFIEKQLKRNMSFVRDRKAKQVLEIPVSQVLDISSKISQHEPSPKSNDSSERIGIKGEEFKLDRNEMEQYLQNKFIEFKQAIANEVAIVYNTASRADQSFNLLHEKMIQQIEAIKIKNSELINSMTQQMVDIVNDYGTIPKFTQEIIDVQKHQQQIIQKLLQCQILYPQLHSEEICLNGQILSQQQGSSMVNSLIKELVNEVNIFDSPPKKFIPPQITTDESPKRGSIRIKTASQSGLRRSAYSQTRTMTTEKRKLYLLGSRIQQELSMNESLLNQKRTNTKLLFQSKANHD